MTTILAYHYIIIILLVDMYTYTHFRPTPRCESWTSFLRIRFVISCSIIFFSALYPFCHFMLKKNLLSNWLSRRKLLREDKETWVGNLTYTHNMKFQLHQSTDKGGKHETNYSPTIRLPVSSTSSCDSHTWPTSKFRWM